MRRECRERFHHHRLHMKLVVSDHGMHRGTCVVMHVGIAILRWRRKLSRHSWHMHNLSRGPSKVSIVSYISRGSCYLFPLLLRSLWCVQMIWYNMVWRLHSFVFTLHYLIFIILQAYLTDGIEHIKLYPSMFCRMCIRSNHIPQLSSIQSVGRCLIVIFTSEIWLLNQSLLGLCHETMARIVCRIMFLFMWCDNWLSLVYINRFNDVDLSWLRFVYFHYHQNKAKDFVVCSREPWHIHSLSSKPLRVKICQFYFGVKFLSTRMPWVYRYFLGCECVAVFLTFVRTCRKYDSARGVPYLDLVYTRIPLGDPVNTCMVHWNTTGKT